MNRKVNVFSSNQLFISVVPINELVQIKENIEMKSHNHGLDLNGVLTLDIAIVNPILYSFKVAQLVYRCTFCSYAYPYRVDKDILTSW